MAVLTNWEVRDEKSLMADLNCFEKLFFSGEILGRKFEFSTKEVEYGADFFIYNNEKIKLGKPSKLYAAFMKDKENPYILRDWTVFVYDGDMYIEGYTYKGNGVGFAIQDSIGPYFYAKTGEKILLDIRMQESRKDIGKDFFPSDLTPDLFD